MDILTELKTIFAGIFGNTDAIESITGDTELFGSLGMTSIGMLYMALAIEEKFHISFSNEDVTKFRTVGDIVDYISAKTK